MASDKPEALTDLQLDSIGFWLSGQPVDGAYADMRCLLRDAKRYRADRDALKAEVEDQKNIIVALQISAQEVEHHRGVDGVMADALKDLLRQVIEDHNVAEADWALDREMREAVKDA